MPGAIYRSTYLLELTAAADSGTRRVRGTASTPTKDRQGHILEPAGASWADEIPLLLHHRKETPVGVARLSRGKDAIYFDAELPTIESAGPVRDEVERAWSSITSKPPLIRGVSIGYRPTDERAIEFLKDGGLRFHRTEILELSLVTVPANAEATIAVVKAFDQAYQAAAGLPTLPGDAGAIRRTPTMQTQTISERIQGFEAARAAKVARMDAILAASGAKGETLAGAEGDEFDGFRREVESIDCDLVRLRALEKMQAASATAPSAAVVTRTAAAVVPAISVKSTLPPGNLFIRAVCAKLHKNGNMYEAAQYAETRWKDTPEVALFLKAAVAPATTQDPAWAGALVSQQITKDFIELLRPATAIGKIPGLRKVPFNTKVPAQSGGGTYTWVGEGKPKPVTKLQFSAVSLPIHKAAGIIVLTDEVVKLSNPDAEDIVRKDMIAGIAAFLDSQLLDPAIAAVANVRPASLTNGVTPIASVGPLNDIVALASAFATAKVPVSGLTVIMSPTNALVLSFAVDANGNPSFPDMSAEGGKIRGVNIVTSEAAGNNVVGISPGLVLYADDGGVEIDVSREASIQMSDAPMDPSDATTVLVSLWQNNLMGLRAERFITWLKGHAAAVKYVNNAVYTIPPPGALLREGGNGQAKAAKA